MKNKFWLVLPVLLLTMLLLAACGNDDTETTAAPSQTTAATTGQTPATAGETITLTMSNFFPPTNYHSVLVEWWIKEIETRTNGGVKIEYFPGSSLVAADKTYEAITDNMVDLAMSVVSYSMGRFPAMELLDQPYGHVSPWVSSKVAQDFYDKFKPAEFDDTHVLYYHGNNLSHVLLASKPVRSLADMKGLVIRSSGVGVQVAEALGATGYAGTMAEGYELLSKKVVDGSISGLDALTGWKQAEVIKYITPLGPCTHSAVLYAIMNNDVWDKLPEDYKKVFTEVSAEMPGKHGMVWQYYDKTAVDHLLTLPERERLVISPEDVPNWEQVANGVIDKFAADKKGMGLPVDEYLAYLKDQTARWAAEAPTDDDCVTFVESELSPLATN